MKKKIVSLLLTFTMLVPLMAACGGNAAPSQGSTSKPTDSSSSPNGESESSDPGGSTEAEDFTFSLYYSYDWWTIKPWGEDATSAYWMDKYGVNIEQTRPDSDATAQLNLMVTTDTLPDVILMDRNADWRRVAQMGKFVDLAPLQANNPDYDEAILKSTQELLKIDDVLYSIPHWARKEPTGGNDVWMVNKKIYEAAGSPELNTFEDIYAYAKYVKDNIPETEDGLPVIPFATENNANAFDKITTAFYRSAGGPNKATTYTARIDGKIQSVLRDERFRDVVLEANKWFREGLIYETQFSDTNDQVVEKMASGRTALLYYDFSQDDSNHFRSILREADAENDYLILTDPVYPPAEGVSHVYADHKESVGWNVHNITTAAEEPQKIFDFLTYMLTKQGSIEMMYGPQGGWWDELDSNGNPILKKPEASYTNDEKNAAGSWFWSFCSHSDNVDTTKFAVNEMQPENERSWVISTQANILSPIMYMTDEYVLIDGKVDPLSELGIARKLCEDQYKADIPRAIMAGSEEEAAQIFDDLLKFFDDNRFAEIETIYDERHQEIVDVQGFTAFDKK